MIDTAEFLGSFGTIAEKFPLGQHWRVEHDGFHGVVIGYYVTLEGKPGLVLQLDKTRVVRAYSTKWFE